jgi:hypothetical protein
MTVGELLERIDSRELSEWQIYFDMEPFGEERADLRAGIVAATIANVNRDAKRRKKPFRPQDFMPSFGKRVERAEAPEEVPEMRRSRRLLAIVENLNAAFGGKDIRRSNGDSGNSSGSTRN